MSTERGPEPTPGGDSSRGEVDPGKAVERHPDLGEPEVAAGAQPDEETVGQRGDAPRVHSAAGSAETSSAQPGVPVERPAVTDDGQPTT